MSEPSIAQSRQIFTALEQFGLSEKESLVYLALLKLGQTSPHAISTFTKIPRTTVYDVLMQLALKGLIELEQSDGMSKQQTKIKPKNPSVLREILRQRQKNIIKTEIDILSILPFLKQDYQHTDTQTEWQFYPGMEGAKRVYFHEFDARLPRQVWENMMPMDAFGMLETNEFTSQETKNNIYTSAEHRELIPYTDWTKHVLSYQFGRDPKYIEGRNIRYLDSPLFSCNLSIVIQDERLYITCADDDELWGAIIKSKSLSSFLSSLFELEWTKAVPITTKLIESWGPNQFRLLEQSSKKK